MLLGGRDVQRDEVAAIVAPHVHGQPQDRGAYAPARSQHRRLQTLIPGSKASWIGVMCAPLNELLHWTARGRYGTLLSHTDMGRLRIKASTPLAAAELHSVEHLQGLASHGRLLQLVPEVR